MTDPQPVPVPEAPSPSAPDAQLASPPPIPETPAQPAVKPVSLRHIESVSDPGLRDGVWMSATHFAAAGEEGVGIYDLSQADPQRAPLGTRGDVTALAWMAANRTLILGDSGGEVRSNEFSGRAGFFVNANRAGIIALDAEPDGRRILSVSEQDVCVVDPDGPEWLLDEQHHAAVWLGDGVLATVGAQDVEVWLCETRGRVARIAVPAAQVRMLDYLAEPQFLAVGLRSGEVTFWSLADEPPQQRGVIRQPDGLSALAIARDGMTLATGTASAAVRVWRDFAPQPPPAADAGAAVLALRFSPDGRRLAAITADGISLFAVEEGAA